MNNTYEHNTNEKQQDGIVPVDLLCEYMRDPVGLDTVNPRFSWHTLCDGRGQYQTAYRIVVASSKEKLDADMGDIWDSGKVESGKSINIAFEGRPLTSRQICFWKVRIWDRYLSKSTFSVCSRFEMGLLQQEDWRAVWIGSPVFGAEAPLFRKTFTIGKKVTKARVYLSGLGYYELHINGRKVGDHILDPAWTDYGKRVFYATYEVEDFLEQGSNAIGVMLGAGWYGKAYRNNVHAVTQLLLQLELEFEDGTTEYILTGPKSGWKVHSNGPVTFSSIYDGESYDARLEIDGWDLAEPESCHEGDGKSEWLDPLWMEPPGGRMESQRMEPIKVMQELKPISLFSPKPGIHVYDMGQNMAGWVKLQVSGPWGTKVILKYSELLYKDGTVNQENLRTAKATDTYILKGVGLEVYEPRFTFHGFRYVQVEGFPGEASMDAVTGRFVRSSVEQAGRFHCSNALLNKIQENVVWTEANNLHGVPSDCPQRDERLAWLNDMTVRAEEAVYNFNLAALYTKWLKDIADTQGAVTGAIADTAPFHRYGRRPADPVCSSYLIVPWLMYLHYGDQRILEEHYEGFKRWMSYLEAHSDGYIINYSCIGDWASPRTESVGGSLGGGAVSAKTPGKLMSTGFYYYNAILLAEIARLLGKPEDVRFYEELSGHIKKAFNDNFYNSKTRRYATGSQASNVFPLYLGLVPKGNEKAVMDNIVMSVLEENNGHLTTGNICTKYILEVLTEAGRMDIAYLLATQETYPSWGYMISRGATTIWERWEYLSVGDECEMASHDHPMYGSISAWFYKMLGGINVDSEGPGFERIIIKPYIPEELEFAEASVKTMRGLVSSKWEKSKNSLEMQVTIPFNSRAKVYIPFIFPFTETEIKEGNNTLWKYGKSSYRTEELFVDGHTSDYLIIQTGSGAYCFTVAPICEN